MPCSKRLLASKPYIPSTRAFLTKADNILMIQSVDELHAMVQVRKGYASQISYEQPVV